MGAWIEKLNLPANPLSLGSLGRGPWASLRSALQISLETFSAQAFAESRQGSPCLNRVASENTQQKWNPTTILYIHYSMYVYNCVYIYIYVCARVYTYMCICVCVCVCMSECPYVCIQYTYIRETCSQITSNRKQKQIQTIINYWPSWSWWAIVESGCIFHDVNNSAWKFCEMKTTSLQCVHLQYLQYTFNSPGMLFSALMHIHSAFNLSLSLFLSLWAKSWNDSAWFCYIGKTK